MLNFVLIGAAGYVAPRHMKAIKEVGGNLVAAYDPNDSIGILDSMFPDCKFFTTLEELNLFFEQFGRVDYVCICSPNHMHLPHIAFGLRWGRNVICEKPLVLKASDLDLIKNLETKNGGKVYTILQLRLHPVLLELKARINMGSYVSLTYHTPRGDWYHKSWKGDKNKSGGLLMNIGIHLFDAVQWLFGSCEVDNALVNDSRAVCAMRSKTAIIDATLSTEGEKPRRSMFVNGEQIDFTDGFTDLHTKSYQEILAGRGFTVDDVRPSIELVNKLQNEGTHQNTALRSNLETA